MEASAKLSSIRLSPRKTRLVVDLVRGKGIQLALNTLRFCRNRRRSSSRNCSPRPLPMPSRRAFPMWTSLYVKTIFVDGGAVLKRFTPRAMGRASKIRKPTSHITVVLAEKK